MQLLCAPFMVRLLGPGDLPAVRSLREVVLSTLAHPDLYVRETGEGKMLHRNLNEPERGQTLGIFNGGTLIGYGMVSYPGAADEHNLGRWLQLPRRELSLCAVMEGAMVHPSQRCLGWQKLLLRLRGQLAAQRGKAIFTAMASLANWISRRNLLGAGYVVAACADVETNLRRHIFARGIHSLSGGNVALARQIDVLDFDAQRAAVAEGLIGVREHGDSERRSLCYVSLPLAA